MSNAAERVLDEVLSDVHMILIHYSKEDDSTYEFMKREDFVVDDIDF